MESVEYDGFAPEYEEMVEAVRNPGTLSVIRRFRPHADLQGIRADYYNLTDLQGQPLAGLLVLMDRRGRPVRAEIHMNNNTADALYEIALRQSLRLIEDRYRSERPIRLYPLRMQLNSDPLSVQPRGSAQSAAIAPAPASSNPLLLVGAVLLAISALFSGWFLNEWLTGELTQSSSPATLSAGSSSSAAGQNVLIVETNGLPPSRNAIPMNVGDRIRLLPEYKISLRTEAGAQAGVIVTHLQDADPMTILNGPIWLEGNTDTIVWWYVRVDSGAEGWVPANTSELTLLEPFSQ
ncbi:MAG: SH3 domain-containing protein [Caldilineaceae bacterium]|nr:SH3 domain-containing protein [Caldilineaceae bacterium]MCY3989669.1 SH3 domain-containing protein [Caldilineaceae bacterium]MDE0076626.1 SH3 domain-containing protein [Caldilineaceae bacterium]MDE0310628.1 SH3 domain-containing protein [Caldilineaceae bacterium]